MTRFIRLQLLQGVASQCCPTEQLNHIAPDWRRRNGRLHTEARLCVSVPHDLSHSHVGAPMKRFTPNANERSPHRRVSRLVSGCVTERDAGAWTTVRAHHAYRGAQKGAQPFES